MTVFPGLRRPELHRRRHGEGGAGARRGRRPARSRSTSRWTAASTPTTAPVAVAAGANVLVAGSAIFGQPRPWEAADAIRRRPSAPWPRPATVTPVSDRPGGRGRRRRHHRHLARVRARRGRLLGRPPRGRGGPRRAPRCATSDWSGSAAGVRAAELDVARRARRRWEEVGAAVPGIGFRPMSSLTVAGDDAARGRHGGVRPRTPTPRRVPSRSWSPTRCAPATRRSGVTSPARCTAPRTPWSSPAWRWARCAPTWRRRAGRGTASIPGRRVVAAEPHALVDTTGTRWEGDLVVARHRRGLRPPPGHRRRWRPACAGSGCRWCRRRPSPAR